MTEPLSSELLARYLAGEANQDEREMVDAWAKASPANAADLAHMRDVWKSKTPAGNWDVDGAWKKVQARTKRTESMTQLSAKRSPGASLAMKIAAGLILVAGGVYGWRFTPWSGAPGQTYTTAQGELKTIDLADGTHIVIGPLSELRVRRRYNEPERNIELTGQAWFEVTHDSAHVFRVHSLGTITEDLGTSFAVRGYESDSIVNVVVTTGTATVRLAQAPPDQAAILKAGDVIDVNTKTLKANVARNVAAASLVAWHTGKLEFNNAPLSAVAAELKRWYGVTMQFGKPEIADRLVAYTMPTNDLDEVIKVLGSSLVLKVERKGDTVFVR